jgi:prephenate dehydrogenase
LKQWGSYDYEKIKAKDVLKVTVPVNKVGTSVEKLTFRFEKGNMIIEWDTTQVKVAIG